MYMHLTALKKVSTEFLTSNFWSDMLVHLALLVNHQQEQGTLDSFSLRMKSYFHYIVNLSATDTLF